MAVKSLNIAINEYCNNKCIMCDIWKNPRQEHLTPEDYHRFLSVNDFSYVEDVSISGGEPFMRKDIGEVVDSIIINLPKLKMLFFNTNGTYPKRVRRFVDEFAPRVDNLYGCVSIEGEKEVHNIVRGVNSYEIALLTLSNITSSGHKNVHGIISTTITSSNQQISSLEHVKYLSERFSCDYTFRTADISGTYYLNLGHDEFKPSKDNQLVGFIDEHKADNPFMQILRERLISGKVQIMGDKKEGIRCEAGNIFVFIDARGNIHPCIYSPRIIGSIKSGFSPVKLDDLGSYEPCPCCTECNIYPMLNYGDVNVS